MSIQIGDRLPSGTVHEGTPRDHVDPASLLGTGKAVLVGVVGAFTGNCNNQIPAYVADADKWAAKGYATIACLTVNDAFVTAAWGDQLGATGKIRMLADPSAAYTKSLGLEVDAPGPFGGPRSKRFVALLDEGVVTHLEVEPDSFGLSCSISGTILDKA